MHKRDFATRMGVASVVLSSLWVGGSASAAIIYTSGGFESPQFTNGNLSGQDGWGDSGLTPSTAVVQSDFVHSGSQAVQVTRAASSSGDSRWGRTAPVLNATGQVSVAWDMLVNLSTTLPNAPYGPFFGVEAYDAFESTPLLAGSLGVDAGSGEVLFQKAETGVFEAAGTVEFGEWNHFEMRLNYDDGSYSVYVNGDLRHTEGFVDHGIFPGIFDFTDAPISTLAVGDGDYQLASGSAFFDNYVVSVPEPGLACLGLAGGAIFLRRRRSSIQ